MVEVKVPRLPPLPEGAEPHVAALTGRLLEVVRRALRGPEWEGLRSSHFRLLSAVPATGSTISDLAVALAMTKQGVGQFVTSLQASGHVEVTTDAHDRRRRVVRRTDAGDRVVAEVDATIRALEQHWSDLVGPDRYAAFRSVLEQIALAAPEHADGEVPGGGDGPVSPPARPRPGSAPAPGRRR